MMMMNDFAFALDRAGVLGSCKYKLCLEFGLVHFGKDLFYMQERKAKVSKQALRINAISTGSQNGIGGVTHILDNLVPWGMEFNMDG